MSVESKKNEIILFGAGIKAEKFLIKHSDVLITSVWDNYKTGKFYNYSIQKPAYKENIFIVVACGEGYFGIKQQLEEMGYKEFENFIYDDLYEKKVTICYGNCHASFIKIRLEECKAFSDQYAFYPLPPVQMLDINILNDNLLKNIDLFLYQDIRDENKYGVEYGVSNIISRISSKCKMVCFPNLYGLPECLFPQLSPSYFQGIDRRLFPYKDKNIEQWMKEGKTKNEIVSFIQDGGVYRKEKILMMWDKFCEKISKREENWDVKIADFVFENYQKRRIFYDKWHPTEELLTEIARRILLYMNIPADEFVKRRVFFDNYESFIYKDVRDALGIDFREKYIRKYDLNSLFLRKMDIYDYVEFQMKMLHFIRAYE